MESKVYNTPFGLQSYHFFVEVPSIAKAYISIIYFEKQISRRLPDLSKPT